MSLRTRVRRWAWIALGVIFAVTLVLGFLPLDRRVSDNYRPLSHKMPAIRCLLRGGCRSLLSSRPFLLDWVGNVIFFVPLGIALALITWPGRREAGGRWAVTVILIGALFSISIEAGQLLVPGRATDVDDVMLNTLGVILGLIIARVAIAIASFTHRLMVRP